MTDAEVKKALWSLQALACTIYGEARSEPIEGKVFVGCVVRNRVNTPNRWGDTYERVCLARWQFSCWMPEGGASNYAETMRAARYLLGDGPATGGRALTESLFLAEGIIGGPLQDNSRKSNHYMTRVLFESKPPRWARGQTPVVTVGAHVGFKL